MATASRDSGDRERVQPWHVVRQDGHGNRYRVGSYPTRAEAQRVVDHLRTLAPGGPDPDPEQGPRVPAPRTAVRRGAHAMAGAPTDRDTPADAEPPRTAPERGGQRAPDEYRVERMDRPNGAQR
ncbi:hypothetical protein [Streptomyces sp. NPDC005438]|uniref:hypothetical protein n=1 Tax=Streptomyces sp. NPDC005438 TaxID=3156880 RepID=UPI00339F079C